MKFLQNMKIGIRLGTGFMVLIIITVVLGITSISQMTKLAVLTQKLYDHPFAVSNAVLEIEKDIVAMHLSMKDIALAKSNEEIDKVYSTIDKYEKEIMKDFELIKERFLGEKYYWEEAMQAIVDWRSIRESAVRDMKAGNFEQATLTTETTGVEQIRLINEKMERLLDFARNKAVNFMGNANKEKKSTLNTMYVILAGAAVLGIFISLLITGTITKPLKTVVTAGNKIRLGQLPEQDIDVQSKDEIGQVLRMFNEITNYLRRKGNELDKIANGDFKLKIDYASNEDQFATLFEKTVTSLNDSISQVKTSAEQITTGSSQISDSSQSLSQGATEQASSLEEISSSINQIAGQVKQNADNATQANTLTKTAMENAEKGNGQMKDLVESMSRINISTDEIKKIVKVIDDIAFQINLLALNANVEAARAGKYGKGFAVVAEEVRNLANRSANSVKDTTNMVEEAIKNVENGNGLVEETAEQLAEIVNGTEKVLNLMQEIALASNDQSKGIEQISTGLSQIEKITQANAANAEENASSAEELASQASMLQEMVNRFSITNQIGETSSLNNHKEQKPVPITYQGQNTIHKADASITYDEKNNVDIKGKQVKKQVKPSDVIKLSDKEFGKF